MIIRNKRLLTLYVKRHANVVSGWILTNTNIQLSEFFSRGGWMDNRLQEVTRSREKNENDKTSQRAVSKTSHASMVWEAPGI